MTTDRSDCARSTLLSDGRVLVTGGTDLSTAARYATAEIYNEASGSWTKTGSMTYARCAHSATLLKDGKVLVAGCASSKKAELYDPATGKFTLTGEMKVLRCGQSASLLADGRVLLAGGANGPTQTVFLASAEIYDPGTGRFTATGSLKDARDEPESVLLPDGRVMIVGGDLGIVASNDYAALDSAEIYDPATGRFSTTGSMATPRTAFNAVLLRNGKVLVAGVNDVTDPAAETYDPATGKFTVVLAWADSLARSLGDLRVFQLPDGRVLILGSSDSGPNAAIYDQNSGTISPTVTLAYDTAAPPPVMLADGSVLIPGDPSIVYVP